MLREDSSKVNELDNELRSLEEQMGNVNRFKQ